MASRVSIPQDAIVTYTGKVIRPLDPDPEQIDIEDIAHSLSNQCRFTGHTRLFYSTAQHSVLCARYLAEKNSPWLLWGLLHDASEAYLSDIARPVKNAGNFGGVYREAETIIMEAVSNRFDLSLCGFEWSDYGMPSDVKHADDVLLRTEMRDLMPRFVLESLDWQNMEMLERKIRPWTPFKSYSEFMTTYRALTGDV